MCAFGRMRGSRPAGGRALDFFHSRLQRELVWCDRGLGDFMTLYGHEFACSGLWRSAAWPSSLRPASGGRLGRTDTVGRPVHVYPQVVFSNLVGGWLGFWQSERILHFAKLWHRWEAGWVYRWSDQQFWFPALRAANASDSRIADFSDLRKDVFDHTKGSRVCSRPRPWVHPKHRKVQDAFGRWVLPTGNSTDLV
jgi:hypothetical protein